MGTDLLIKTGSFVNVSSDVTQKWNYHTKTRDLRKSFFFYSNSEDIDPCNTEIKYIKKTLVSILPSHLQNGLQVLLDQCLKTWNIHENNSVTLDKIFLKTQTWHILKVR